MKPSQIRRKYAASTRGVAHRVGVLLDIQARAGVQDLDPEQLATKATEYLRGLPVDDVIHILANHWDLVAVGLGLQAETVLSRAEEPNHS